MLSRAGDIGVGMPLASPVDGDSGGSDGDVFTTDKAWCFITLLT